MKKAIVVFTICFFVLFSQTANAAAPVISNVPSTVNTDNEFTFLASMDGVSKNTVYRLRVAVSASGSTEYFGSTYNGSSWNKGSINDGNFISVTTDDSGIWNGDMKGKIELSDPNFKNGAGTYELKVGRYTETGSTATWSNSVTLAVSAPPLTATPTLPPTNTPTPQNTPTPTKTPTPTPTTKAASTPSPTPPPTATGIVKNPSPTKVLGASTKSIVKKPSPTVAVQGIQTTFDFVPLFFIGGGILLLLSCAILTFHPQLEKLWKRE